MDTREIQRALTTLIDFFDTGNNESDAAAKAVLVADSEYDEYWRPEIERFRKSVEWTGLRGPEAEMLVSRLRQAVELIAVEKITSLSGNSTHEIR
jgi:IMP cyclohydrolase